MRTFRGGVGIVHQEVDLLLWMLCLKNDLGVRVRTSKPDLCRSPPDQLMAETSVEPDRFVQIVDWKADAVDLPETRCGVLAQRTEATRTNRLSAALE